MSPMSPMPCAPTAGAAAPLYWVIRVSPAWTFEPSERRVDARHFPGCIAENGIEPTGLYIDEIFNLISLLKVGVLKAAQFNRLLKKSIHESFGV
jgi:hypothetical protein